MRAGKTHDVPLHPTLAVNDLDILHDAVLGGVGIAVLPTLRCAEDLRAGRLQRVLPGWEVPGQPVHALYPSGRHLPQKLKTMLDHLQSATGAPWGRPQKT